RIAQRGLDRDAALAAWSLLLWRLNGLEPVPLVVAGSEAAPSAIPMMPRPRDAAALAELGGEGAQAAAGAGGGRGGGAARLPCARPHHPSTAVQPAVPAPDRAGRRLHLRG